MLQAIFYIINTYINLWLSIDQMICLNKQYLAEIYYFIRFVLFYSLVFFNI